MTNIEHLDVMAPGAAAPPPEADEWRRAAEQALTHAVAGQTAAALVELDGIDPHHRRAAVDALAERAAQVLERLQHRSQYRIPLGYVIDRIPLDPGVDLDLCVHFLADAMFRSVGVHLPRPRADRPDAGEELVVAVAAATGVVRFAAARWWTSAEAVLDMAPGPSVS